MEILIFSLVSRSFVTRLIDNELHVTAQLHHMLSFISFCFKKKKYFGGWRCPIQEEKKLKTNAGPVSIFPEKNNPVGSAVTEILSFKIKTSYYFVLLTSGFIPSF